MIAVESLLFLLAGIALAVILTQVFGRGAESSRGRAGPVVKLVRSVGADGQEETRLTVNDQVILTASSEGLRLADYTEQVERLEAVATRIADALGVHLEFARAVPRRAENPEEGIPVHQLPRQEAGKQG